MDQRFYRCRQQVPWPSWGGSRWILRARCWNAVLSVEPCDWTNIVDDLCCDFGRTSSIEPQTKQNTTKTRDVQTIWQTGCELARLSTWYQDF